MPRKPKEPKVVEPYYCPKCGNEVPRTSDGILVTIHNREMDKGCCSDCGDKPSPELLDKAMQMIVDMLAESLWKNHRINWNQLPMEWPTSYIVSSGATRWRKLTKLGIDTYIM